MTVPFFKHAPLDTAWLARLQEDILEPALPIVDAHHHLWDRDGGYFLDEILADTTAGHNITDTVFVQCGYGYRDSGPEAMRPVGETTFVTALAERGDARQSATRLCSGIVGYADLLLGDDVAPVLQAHIDEGHGRFRGIRHLSARDLEFVASLLTPPKQFLLADPVFRQGVAQLAKFNLSYDAWLYHTQIDELTDLARAFPDLPIILNHVGGPLGVGPYAGKRDEVYAAWLKSIKTIATCPNVTVKLGGLAMAITGFTFHDEPLPPSSGELATAWRPYVAACIEAFGAERCMFESNSPVDKGMCSYPVLWNAYKRLAAGASASEKTALFHGTATRVYRLGA